LKALSRGWGRQKEKKKVGQNSLRGHKKKQGFKPAQKLAKKLHQEMHWADDAPTEGGNLTYHGAGCQEGTKTMKVKTRFRGMREEKK